MRNTKVIFRGLLVAGLLLAGLVRDVHAAHTQAQLVLAADAARPGETVLAGVHLRMEARWHTYWRNSGEVGIPTTIAWSLPPGVTAGPVQWPVPEKFLESGLTTYVYHNEVVLLVPLTLASNAPAGALTLKAKVGWLECDKECVPGSANLQATLTVGPESKAGAAAGLLDTWSKKLPLTKPASAARAWWEKAAAGDKRNLIIEWTAANPGKGADFYPYDSDKFDVDPKTEVLTADAGKIRLRKIVQNLDVKQPWPTTISGLLLEPPGAQRAVYEAALPIKSSATAEAAVPETASVPVAPAEPAASAPAASAVSSTPAVPTPPSLWRMLGYAFLGGLILNVMPCVLPVIALKILGFVKQAREQPGEVRRLGLVYAAGVLVSFLALAGLVIAAKAAGQQVGWGMQFNNPQFIVVMTVLVTLVALNLFGLFEINLGGRIMGAAGELGTRNGAPGAFFNGLLTTILATPCTAAYLGTALGFAFTQTYPMIVVFFLTVGLGLALPYVVLCWHPAWLQLMPKPGAWMEKFKIAMGFPMLATAVWLMDITTVYYGQRVLWLAIFLVLVGLAAWIYGEFFQRSRRGRGFALATVLLVLVGGYAYAIEGQLRWRSPVVDVANATDAAPWWKTDANGIDWQPWSPQAVAEARAAGHPVLVDFTAKWCAVCRVNSATSLEVNSVQKKLRDLHAVALVGDYTKFPDNITAELGHFGRGGVPLVLVYPGNPDSAPVVLPDGYLTPGIVLDALAKAAQSTVTTISASNH